MKENKKRNIAFSPLTILPLALIALLLLLIPILSAAEVYYYDIDDELKLENKKTGMYKDEYGLLTYNINNGGITIMSCSEAAKGAMSIPASINGVPVKTINDYAFLYCAGLTSVTLPESVESIGANAFSCCTGLKSVEIRKNGVSVGRRSFFNCNNLIELKVNASQIGDAAFRKCSKLVSADISAVSIGASAFSECKALKNIKLASGITSIGQSAFQSCTALSEIVDRKSVV